MYARSLSLPDYSFFLFGPRGTGKTTWLREHLSQALWRNLLLDSDYLPLLADTSLLRPAVEALPEGSWVVLDEVQRIPAGFREGMCVVQRSPSRRRAARIPSCATSPWWSLVCAASEGQLAVRGRSWPSLLLISPSAVGEMRLLLRRPA